MKGFKDLIYYKPDVLLASTPEPGGEGQRVGAECSHLYFSHCKPNHVIYIYYFSFSIVPCVNLIWNTVRKKINCFESFAISSIVRHPIRRSGRLYQCIHFIEAQLLYN